ncbi:unnamed protein product, partial [Amoebophrya sp. A25]
KRKFEKKATNLEKLAQKASEAVAIKMELSTLHGTDYRPNIDLPNIIKHAKLLAQAERNDGNTLEVAFRALQTAMDRGDDLNTLERLERDTRDHFNAKLE